MPSITVSPNAPSLKEQLVREACSMVRHLVTNGTRVPAQLVQSADRFETASAQGRSVDMAALASVHERLSRLVAPAKPGTLYLLDDSFHQAGQSSLGPVRLVRDLVRVAMACVAVFIVLSVMTIVDAHPSVQLFGRNMLILEIILERVFWLAAAGIGASFAMLFQLNDQILNRTFDPDENAAYWVKFFLGVVAGFILVALVPLEGATTPGGAESGAQALGPPTIALLGGFSASAVYRILTRMVEALESIFSGGAKEQVLAAEKAAVTRAAEETSQARMAVAGQLVEIQQRLAAGMSANEASTRLQQVVAGLMPGGTEEVDTVAAPADKVPALAVVAAPEDVAAQPDASAPADAPAAEEEQPREAAAAAG